MAKRILLIYLLGILSACANNRPLLQTDGVVQPRYQSQLADLADVSHWEIKGRISIQTTEDAFSASFKWRRLVDYQRIEITGMLGQQYAILEITPEQSSLSVQDRAPIVATDIDELMWSQIGFTIPVALLTDWIKALPNESTEQSIRINEQGMIREMSFQNWSVTYKKYKDYPNYGDLLLPSRTTVTNDRETIKLAIKTWQPL